MSSDPMSQEIAIKIEGLAKKYLIGHNSTAARPKTFREALTRGVKSTAKSIGEMAKLRQLVAGDEIEEFWALQNVSLEIRKGDAIAVIGKNGAGKSTLLKVLSRITEPTTGRIEINGRIASLLEVGTGFHPELTGRENIFLNGAILGMSRKEIQGKIDRIIDFAGVEKFIDTPVKRYSSGMYVRLAFSVAAHLDPEILIVDEVLAVGDASFQSKCHDLMRDLANSGKTVLFVSHNLRSLRALCRNGVLLEGGKIKTVGCIDKVLDEYQLHRADSDGLARLGPIDLDLQLGLDRKFGELFEISMSSRKPTSISELNLIITNANEERVCILNLQKLIDLPREVDVEPLRVRIHMESPRLVEGTYWIGCYLKAEGVGFQDLSIRRLDVPHTEGVDTFYPPEVRGVVESKLSVDLLK